jgi:rhodanese-related sulfurtransferase
MKRLYFLLFFIFCGLTCLTYAQEKRLTVKEFAGILEKAEHPQILDARSAEEFAGNRIKGAISVPVTDRRDADAIVGKLNPDAPTFTYSINSGRGEILAGMLRRAGFREVYALPGGLAAWVGEGYPIETSGTDDDALTVEQFGRMIASGQYILASFGSGYCGGCRRLVPVVEALKKEYAGQLKTVEIKLEENPAIIRDQKIEALPTLILFRQAAPVWRHRGFISGEELSQTIGKFMHL